MSLFKGTKAKAKLNPRTEESKFGGSWLMNDLNWDKSPNYPTRQVAGMTGKEQGMQDNIYNQAMNGGEGFNLAMDHTRKTLDGGYDPRDSDYYKGYRAEMEDMRGESNARLQRRSQKGGMVNSTSAYGMEADNNRRIDNSIMRQLGGMYENERNRMDGAANTAAGLDGQQFGQSMAAAAEMAKERAIEQLRYDEIYKTAYQELMHQYNVLAPIAGNMMNYSPGTYMQPDGPSVWDVAMGVTSDVMGIAGGISGIKANNARTNWYNTQANNPASDNFVGPRIY